MKKRFLSFLLAAVLSISAPFSSAALSDTENTLEQREAEPLEGEMQEQIKEETELPLEETKFAVYTEAEHGSVSIIGNRKLFSEGDTVEFMVLPEEGYRIRQVTAVSEKGETELFSMDGASYILRMPACEVRINAVFEFMEQEPVANPNVEELNENSKGEEERIREESSVSRDGDSLENFDFTLFNEENAGLLHGETAQEEELVQEIEEGAVIAFAPVANLAPESSAMVMSVEEGEISRAAGTGSFQMRQHEYCNMDEVWVNNGAALNHNGTIRRSIEYIDDEGVKHSSPLYCMNASKSGPLTNQTVKEEAIKALSNSSIRKILYYGYGGPGDISDVYDPTCSHCDWSKHANRFVLTHFALSKVYSNDVAGATAAECEHVGLNRWINKLTSFALPNVTDLKFNGKKADGDMVSAKDMTGNLIFWRVVPDILKWTEFKDGLQLSNIYTLTASLNSNGIRISRTASDTWVLGYWTDLEDYHARGRNNPRVLKKGSSVTLQKGAKFRFAFPYNLSSNQKFTFTSVLKPVEYIAISSSVQMNQSNMQDLGTYYYEGTREKLSLTFLPSSYGTVVLDKVAEHDSTQKIEGAGYCLTAAENIVSNEVTVLKKGEKLMEAYTDQNGRITFSYVPAGSYDITEIQAKPGTEAEKYKIDVNTIPLTVSKNKVSNLTIKEIPDMKGSVSIRKVIEGTELELEGAEFTLYSWSKSSGRYTNGFSLTYNRGTKRYESPVLEYTADNQGKFQIKETQNPKGFTGTFMKEFTLTKLGQTELFEFTAANTILPKRVEITKVDSVTRESLPDAEFTLYEWNRIRQDYESVGQLLSYDAASERYFSKELTITELNTGKFKVTETKVPDGYTGIFEKELDLNDTDVDLQYIAENIPEAPAFGRIKIKKTDSVTGNILSDAEFTVYQYHTETGKYEDTLGEKAMMFYDQKSQMYLSEELPINKTNTGKFKVAETKNPKGYKGSWQKEFVLTEEHSEPEPFEVQNEPDRPSLGEITVIKKIREREILREHGNPVFCFVLEGNDRNHTQRKYENYISFQQDGYEVDADGYAVMQLTFRNVPEGEYQVYEKPVLYYYLEDAYANTSNVSIIKGVSASYGQNPKSVAYGNVRLSASENKASLTFINKKARYDHYIHNDVVKNRISIGFWS